jgi:hypothetical protein
MIFLRVHDGKLVKGEMRGGDISGIEYIGGGRNNMLVPLGFQRYIICKIKIPGSEFDLTYANDNL